MMNINFFSLFKRPLLIIALLAMIGGSEVRAYSAYGNRIYYGGYLGVDLGLINQYEISPLAGYRITPWLNAGAGAKYQYYHNKQVGSVFSSHIFGPILFTDIVPVSNINDLLPFRFLEAGLYIHGEVDLFSLPVSYFDTENRFSGQNRFFRPSWIAGAGLRSVSDTGRNLNIMIIIDLSGHERKIYANPAVRIGFMF
ncbi:MAG: hypothetical protein EA408_07295 [Marinilabiliales bacterium]|nr:MAG: hypothetical protein EA408_07295 [Marinilabiliales bacterium]